VDTVEQPVARPIHLCAAAGGSSWRCYRPASVGRSPGADIHLQDPSVSRAHALIGRCGRGWSVRDTGSTNGTFLNGSRVPPATGPFPLRPGDLIQFGAVALRVGAVQGLSFAPIRPEWLARNDGAVARVAGAIAAEGRFEGLPVLADALEDAGCCEPRLLGPLRSPLSEDIARLLLAHIVAGPVASPTTIGGPSDEPAGTGEERPLGWPWPLWEIFPERYGLEE
jgi:hypothetical protein